MVEVFTYFWNNSCQPLGDAKRSWWCGTNPADFAGGVAIAVPLWFVGGWPYGQQARGCRVILIILMQPCWFVAGSMSGGWLAGRCRKIDSLEVVATNAIGIFWASCEVKRMVTFVRSCHRRFPPWCWLPFVLEFCMHFLILRHWCFVYPSIHDIRFSSSQITAFMFWGMVGSVRGSRAKEASSRSLWHTPAQSGDPELCWQNAFVPRYIFWRFNTVTHLHFANYILLKEVAFRIPPVVTDPLKNSVDATVKKSIEDWNLAVKQWNQKHQSSLGGQSGGNDSVSSGSQQQSQSPSSQRTGSRPVFLPGEKKIDISHNHIFSDDCVIPLEAFEGGNECLCCASYYFHPTVWFICSFWKIMFV